MAYLIKSVIKACFLHKIKFPHWASEYTFKPNASLFLLRTNQIILILNYRMSTLPQDLVI